jgi:hypothetical protein
VTDPPAQLEAVIDVDGIYLIPALREQVERLRADRPSVS